MKASSHTSQRWQKTIPGEEIFCDESPPSFGQDQHVLSVQLYHELGDCSDSLWIFSEGVAGIGIYRVLFQS